MQDLLYHLESMCDHSCSFLYVRLLDEKHETFILDVCCQLNLNHQKHPALAQVILDHKSIIKLNPTAIIDKR